MRYSVTVQPSGKQFTVSDEQTILEAALSQSVVLPYGCRTGACGSCKARVLEGEIDQGPHSANALRPEEIRKGLALLCCARPRTDLVIEARVVMAGEPRRIPLVTKGDCGSLGIAFLLQVICA